MTRLVFTGILASICLNASFVAGQTQLADKPSDGQSSLKEAAGQGQYAFILFYRQNDVATQRMQQILQAAIAKGQMATIIPVNIGNAAERQLVDRFDASRTPMPAVVAVAPNGAVTGVFAQRVTPKQLASAIVSSGEAACVKALQDQKLVLLCVQPSESATIPTGVQQFVANEEYKSRSQIVNVKSNDPNELQFVKQLGLSPQSTTNVVFMAPPGVMVGTFDANVTDATLIQKLVAAGKCCDDPNCKHDRAAHSNRRTRR